MMDQRMSKEVANPFSGENGLIGSSRKIFDMQYGCLALFAEEAFEHYHQVGKNRSRVPKNLLDPNCRINAALMDPKL